MVRHDEDDVTAEANSTRRERRQEGSRARPVDPSLGRGARRRRQTRVRLIRAAHELMASKGIGATTIQEITDSADVGFGTFYNHFESKEAIIQSVVQETTESYGNALDRLADTLDDPAEIVSVSVRYVMTRGSRDPTWGWFLLRAALPMASMRTGFGARLLRDVRRGVREGRFRTSDARHATMAIAGSTLSILAARLHGELGEDAPEIAAALALKLTGLSARQAEAIAHRPLPDLPSTEPQGPV